MGVLDGKKIRIHYLGHASDVYSSEAGDLLLEVKVKEHSVFKIEVRDIISEVSITLTQAILGDKLTIETVTGKLNINIAPGTQNGDRMVLRHNGAHEFNPPALYDKRALRGHHIITFKLVIPADMEEEELSLLRKFSDLEQKDVKKFYNINVLKNERNKN